MAVRLINALLITTLLILLADSYVGSQEVPKRCNMLLAKQPACNLDDLCNRPVRTCTEHVTRFKFLSKTIQVSDNREIMLFLIHFKEDNKFFENFDGDKNII